jgi:hypothetical protein
MRGRYQPFYLARDYEREVVAKGKCLLDGPGKYKPLFRACDFPSEGFRTTARSWKNKGSVELMSEPEYGGFLYYEYDPAVERIAEQCALDPAETLKIAHDLGIKHPAVAEDPITMSTDLVLDEMKAGVRSRRTISVKREEDLTERVMEKAAIEHECWKRRSRPWTMLLDTHLPPVLMANVRLVHPRHDDTQLPCDKASAGLIGQWLSPHLEEARLPLATLCRRCDQAGLFPDGTALAVALHLIARLHWPVDMRRPVAGHLVLPLLAEYFGQN